jgi:hypothetical protein
VQVRSIVALSPTCSSAQVLLRVVGDFMRLLHDLQ